jgi:hypothetical protein
MQLNSQFKPKLVGQVNLAQSDREPDINRAILNTLSKLDGTNSIEDLARIETSLTKNEICDLIDSLDQEGLVDDCAPINFKRGAEVILEIEDLIDEYASQTIYKNPFWEKCMNAQSIVDLPEKLVIGMIIENWHFLFRESYFDAPVLSYVPNTAVRLLLNQFFSEEYGHDDILLKALNYAGFSRQDMHEAIPLPETMGLCNSLAYWAHTDPLFFFATLGILEGQDKQYDSFIVACQRVGHSEGLVGPIMDHADINIRASHGSLTRAIFQQISVIHDDDISRLKRQIKLFIELYDRFYLGVFRYYTSDKPLLRKISNL